MHHIPVFRTDAERDAYIEQRERRRDRLDIVKLIVGIIALGCVLAVGLLGYGMMQQAQSSYERAVPR